jgi:pyruvate/2-oxoglutarate dehydrogenase complex dihydrolipoamide dehydrogenase (E3) component
MSQFYRRMGSRVTVIEGAGQVAGDEDQDVVSALQRLLEAEGIEFFLNARVKRVENDDGSTKITIAEDNEALAIEASHVFVATGRTPNTEDLGLETVGVKVSERGIVEANHRLATNVEGIWVAGDIRGGPMFTHTSWDDYRILLIIDTKTNRILGAAVLASDGAELVHIYMWT